MSFEILSMKANTYKSKWKGSKNSYTQQSLLVKIVDMNNTKNNMNKNLLLN